jgi:tRNA(fMet)-specific endonuclease VapC
MPRYLLDTNICIYIAKGKPPEVLARFETLAAGDLAMSVITYGELLFGAERSASAAQALATVEQLTAAIPVLPLSLEVAAHYGSIRASLAAMGTPIGNNDLWIAAHARAARLTVVTNDESEFRRVPGLKVENWVDTRS